MFHLWVFSARTPLHVQHQTLALAGPLSVTSVHQDTNVRIPEREHNVLLVNSLTFWRLRLFLQMLWVLFSADTCFVFQVIFLVVHKRSAQFALLDLPVEIGTARA